MIQKDDSQSLEEEKDEVKSTPSFESIIDAFSPSKPSAQILGLDLVNKNLTTTRTTNPDLKQRAASSTFAQISSSLKTTTPSTFSKLSLKSTPPPAPPKPTQQTVSSLLVGQTPCSTFFDSSLSLIRLQFSILPSFLDNNFDFNGMKPSEGKGGDAMGFSTDRKYIVKQLGQNDFGTLEKIAQNLAQHFKQETVICPIFCCFANGDKKYFVMKNMLKFEKEVSLVKLYDLKGCADDKLLMSNGKKVETVHRRFYAFKYWFLSDAQRRAYFQGKLEALYRPFAPITQTQKAALMRVLVRDAEFFRSHGLMDYSLLLAVGEITGDSESESPVNSENPGMYLDGKHIVAVSVIDFLQEYTNAKKCAHWVKLLERNKATVNPDVYASRFINHFKTYIATNKQEQEIRDKDASKLHFRCFPLRIK